MSLKTFLSNYQRIYHMKVEHSTKYLLT